MLPVYAPTGRFLQGFSLTLPRGGRLSARLTVLALYQLSYEILVKYLGRLRPGISVIGQPGSLLDHGGGLHPDFRIASGILA